MEVVDFLVAVLVSDLFEEGGFVLVEEHCDVVEHCLFADGQLFFDVQFQPLDVVHYLFLL